MFCLPVIDEADYEAIFQLMRPVLPRTYSGWLALSDELARERGKNALCEVPVRPADLSFHLECRSGELTLETLLSFVSFNPWHDLDC
jgi:hypothetical protein